jgi:hypothetical protein
MEANLGVIRMIRVRSIATRLRGGWYGLTRSSGRLNCLVAPALAGMPRASPGHCSWSILVRGHKVSGTRSHEKLGATIVTTPVDSNKRGRTRCILHGAEGGITGRSDARQYWANLAQRPSRRQKLRHDLTLYASFVRPVSMAPRAHRVMMRNARSVSAFGNFTWLSHISYKGLVLFYRTCNVSRKGTVIVVESLFTDYIQPNTVRLHCGLTFKLHYYSISTNHLLGTCQCKDNTRSKPTRLLTSVMVPVTHRNEQNSPIAQEEVFSPS